MENWEAHLEKWIVKGKIAKHKGNSIPKESQLAEEGLRFVTFAWPAERWDFIVKNLCEGNDPNIVIWGILEKEIIRQGIR